jgi:hypothetical protein
VLEHPYAFKVVHVDLEDSSRKTKDTKEVALPGYIRPVSITDDTTNRALRNLKMVVQGETMTHTVHFHLYIHLKLL